MKISIRAFAALSSSLKFLDDLLLGLYFDRSSDLFFEGVAEVAQGMKRSITTYPDQEFSIGPGKCLRRREKCEDKTERL